MNTKFDIKYEEKYLFFVAGFFQATNNRNTGNENVRERKRIPDSETVINEKEIENF